MRTTVTLEPDLYARLRQLARERGVPFKVVLNDAVRAGISSRSADAASYRLKHQSMGVRANIDLDKALRLAGELEDAETLRKLELRK